MGSIFEDIARAHTWLLGTVGNLPFSPDRVGSWWDGQEEIDVVAVNHGSREAHLAECKWSGGPLHPRALDELRRKAAYFHARTGYSPRGLALYTRREFSPSLRKKAGQLGVHLYTARDVVERP